MIPGAFLENFNGPFWRHSVLRSIRRLPSSSNKCIEYYCLKALRWKQMSIKRVLPLRSAASALLGKGDMYANNLG